MAYPFELEANLIQIIVLLVLFAWNFARFKMEMGPGGGEIELSKGLYLWGLLAYFLMDLYWVAMICVEGGGDYGTANDVASITVILVWTSLFQTRNRSKLREPILKHPFMITVVIFGIWNAALWIFWNDRVIADIICGFVLVCLMYMIIFSLELVSAVSKMQKVLFIVLFAVLFVFEFPMMFYSSDSYFYIASDVICFIAWLSMVMLFLIAGLKDKAHRTAWFFAALVSAIYAQYLSDGYKYSVFTMVVTVSLLFISVYFNPNDIGEVDE